MSEIPRSVVPIVEMALAAIGVAVGIFLTSAVNAQKGYGPGVTDAEIRIGNTMPYSGPASALGIQGHTMAAYFRKLNDEGGIRGRKIRFISLDDSYSPPKTVEQVRKLVEEEDVLLMFGSLGTPTNSAVQKYLNAKKVPQLFIISAASKWNDPKNYPWTMSMGWGLNYVDEGRLYGGYILRNRPNAKVAVLYQNDDGGRELLRGLKEGLGANGASMLVAEATYEPTDPTVDSQLVTLKASGADTFVNFSTTPKAAIQALAKAHDLRWRPLTFMFSGNAVPERVLKPVGFEKVVGLITVAGMKDVTAPEWQNDSAVLAYQAFMNKYHPDGNLRELGNWYAYMLASILEHVLRQCGDDLTRENVMRKAAGLRDYQSPMLLPQIRINTSADDYSMIDQGQLLRFDGVRWQPFGNIVGPSQVR